MGMLLLEDKIAKAIKSIEDMIPEHFGIDLDYDYSDELEEIDYKIGKIFKNTASVYHGVSKCAIVIPECDWVVKIPFNGYWEYEEIYNEETDEYERVEDSNFVEFYYANDTEYDTCSCDDYCENELVKYEDAVDAGFGEFFLETRHYGYINGHNFYIQKKATPFNETYGSNRKPSDHAKEIYKSNKDLHCRADGTWIMFLIDKYGEERVQEFINFIDEHNMSDDLHSGNIGFNSAGDPVLIDWAGWRY